MSLSSLLSQRCTIRRPTVVNTNGIVTKTYADAATGVQLLVQEKAGSLRDSAGGVTLAYDAIGFFLTSADVRPDGGDSALADELLMTSPSEVNGQKWTVKLVTDEAGKFRLRTVYLRRQHAG